jgi:hypothetical protein
MDDAAEAFHHIAHALKGARISHVWRGYGSALFVECGLLSDSQVRRKDGSSGNPKGRWSIGLDCDWRIEAENSDRGTRPSSPVASTTDTGKPCSLAVSSNAFISENDNRGGGYAPLCYAGDISAADAEAWRD